MNNEETEFLQNYHIEAFERPSIATDIAIFTISEDEKHEDIRKMQKQSLKILLIKRASYPFKNCWALPGGFCQPGEDVSESAKRELYEETHVKNAYLKLINVFGEQGRDPRGWIISNTFMALMDAEQCRLKAGTDAWEARWFTISAEQQLEKRVEQKEEIIIEKQYKLILTNREINLSLEAIMKETKHFHGFHNTVKYEIIDNKTIAFDHAKIILSALNTLRADVEHDSRIAFDMMPRTFTLTQLQNAFEMILNQKLVTANFRRKIAEYVLETNQIVEGVGYRPAKLFERNLNSFLI